MSFNPEIKKIIENSLSKRSVKGINKEKLLYLFDNCQLNFNEYVYNENDLIKIKNAPYKTDPIEKKWIPGLNYRLIKILVPAAAAAVILFAGLYNFFNPSNKNYAEIVSLNGDVNIIRGEKRISLKSGGRVYENDIIETGKKAVIEISYKERIVFRLLETARLSLDRLADHDSLNFNSAIMEGKAIFYVKKLLANDTLMVETPWSYALVRGTVFTVDLSKKNKTVYEVYDGKIKVSGKIPSHKPDLDKSVIVEMKKLFEEHPVTVDKNNACSLSHDEKIFNNLTVSTINDKIKESYVPVLSNPADRKFVMSDEVAGFITDLKKNHSGDSKLDDIAKNVSQVNKNAVEVQNVKELKPLARSSYIHYVPRLRMLISVTEDGTIEATELKKLKWSIKITGKVTGRPAVDDSNRLYLAGSESRIICIDLTQGRILWSKQLEGAFYDRIDFKDDESSLYIALANGTLVKMNKNGDIQWKAQLNEEVISSPVLGKDLVFVALKSGNLIGIDKNHGIKIIRRYFKSSVSSIFMLVNNIYIVTTYGTLYCYDLYKDEILWSFNLNMKSVFKLYFDTTNIYVFNSDGNIIKLDNNGKFQWKTDVGNNISKSPEFDENNILLTTDMAFYQINKKTGDISWSVVIPKVISKNVASSNTNVFFITDKKGIMILKK